MQITTRPFQDADLGRCLEIERAAVRSNHYLNDVIDYYRTTNGEFTLALADSFPAGMGKLTVHFPNQDQQEQEFYQAHGFTVDPSDDVVYER